MRGKDETKEKNKRTKRSKNKKAQDVSEELELLKSQLARTLADYDNLQKRVEREREGLVKFANQTLVERLLPVIDMLEQAQNHLSDGGLAIAIKEFKDLLREDGVLEITAKRGDDFDQDLFEAVEAVEGKEEAKGKVAEMVLSGYRFAGGPLLRPAKVKVYKTKDK